jgi:hypothetical protein
MTLKRAAVTALFGLVGILPAHAQPACDATFRPIATFDMRGIDTPIGVGALGDEIWAMASTYSGNGDYRIFGHHYDGQSWDEIPEPQPSGRFIGYDSKVDETGRVWVVGEEFTEDNTAHLVLRWDGEEWARMDVPPIGSGGRVIAIEPVSPTDVWAVGSFEDPDAGGFERGVILHYDGTAWSINKTIRKTWSELYDVSFSAPTEGWVSGSGYWRDRLLHWDGIKWKWTDYPKREGHDRLISIGGVESVSPDRAWAAASVEIGGGPPDARMLKWNGTRWRKVDIPDPRGSEGNYDLDSNAQGVWTVGGRWHKRHWAPWAMLNGGSGWDRAVVEEIDEEERLTGVVATPEGRAVAIGSVYVDRQQKLIVSEACSS